MKLKTGCKAEYQERHSRIWPQLATLLKTTGISDYSIFWDEETNILFAVQKQDGKSSQELGDTEIVKRWWAYMADLMETNPDLSPISVTLPEVFYLD